MRQNGSFPRWLTITLVVAVFGLLVGGTVLYLSERQRLERSVNADLQAIAHLKADQIVDWRHELLADASIFTQNTGLMSAIRRWLNNPQPEDGATIHDRFSTQEYARYYDILLVDTTGQILYSQNETASVRYIDHEDELNQAIAAGQPILTDLVSTPEFPAPHLDVIAPVFASDAYDASPVGAIVLEIDAQNFLYPLVQSWPLPSKTAETLLIRREGDTVVFLNALRFQPDAALTLNIPLSRADLPASMAAQGVEGIVQGEDYRGVPVIADLRPIPDSNWYMVAKIDRSEAFADVRARTILMLAVALGFVVAAGAVGGAVSQRKRADHALVLLEAETALHTSQERHRITLMSVGDGVIATDSEGRVELMNPVAETLTGWTQDEAMGRPLDEVFRIVDENSRETIESPVKRVMEEGKVVGLANHTLLLARGGMETPIADSGAPIRDPQGTLSGVVLVFRDQTQERAAQREITEREERFRTTLDAMLEGCQIVNSDWCYLYTNETAARQGRSTREALIGHTMMEMYPGIDQTEMFRQLRRCMSERVSHAMVTEFAFQDGSTAWFELSIHPVPEGLFILSVDVTERRKTRAAVERYMRRLEVLHEIDQGIIEARTIEAHYETVLERIRQIIPARRISLWMPDGAAPTGDWRTVVVDTKGGEQAHDDGRIPVGEQWMEAMQNGTTLIVHDATASQDGDDLDRSHWLADGLVSFLHVPLLAQGRLIGSLNLAAETPGFFADEHVEVAVELANQFAIAVEQSRLSAELDRRAAELEVLRQVTLDITSKLDIDHLLQDLMESVARLLNVSIGSLLLYDREKDLLRRAYSVGSPALPVGAEIRRGEGIAGHVLDSGEPLAVTDYARWASHIESLSDKLGTEQPFAVMGVPVVWSDELLGVLIATSGARVFSENDVHLLRLFADQAAIAIHNARQVAGLEVSNQQLEAAVRLRTAELSQANERLQELDRMKDAFLSTAAHELRTPLTSIRAFSELLLIREFEEDRRNRYLTMIKEQSQRLADIINDLLNLSKLEAQGDLEFTFRRVSMAEMISEALLPFSDTFPTHRFEVKGTDDLLPVRGDAFRLEQVITNLISNAVKYSPDGGTVTISCKQGEDSVRVSVQDRGIGMTPDQQAHVFERFYRGVPTITGTGLGLSICKLIVERHGGHIWFESKVGIGSTFNFTVPLARDN